MREEVVEYRETLHASTSGISVEGAVNGNHPVPAPDTLAYPAAQFQSLAALQDDLAELQMLGVDDVYRRKQVHKIPDAMLVDRGTVILEAARGKRVLHLGCGWPVSPLHQAIAGVAAHLIGIDIQAPPGTDCNVWQMDLDMRPDGLPLREYDLIVAGEILEHLGNPGNLLLALKKLFPTTMLIITVPNAFSEIAMQWVRRGYENVNAEHRFWFSYHTLKVLIESAGYTVANWGWYNGQPYTAEGLVFICK